jgi:Bacterial Ig domain
MFSGIAHLNYTVCDAAGTCKTGKIAISVQDGTPTMSDTLFVTTIKNTKIDHVLSHEGYSLQNAPDSGSVAMNNDFTFSYTPKTGFYGQDHFVLDRLGYQQLHVFASLMRKTMILVTFT